MNAKSAIGKGWGVGGDTGFKYCVDTSSTQGDVILCIIPRLELWGRLGEVTGKNILKKNKIPHIYVNDEVTGKQHFQTLV